MPAGATMTERRDSLARDADRLRRAVVCEPRGHSAVVGALLTPPVEPGSLAGVIFFNNGTYLGMCGHGLMGVVRTLAHLGRLAPGVARFDTPVGTVSAELAADGSVTVENVPARCHALDVRVDVPGVGTITGDVAYGGNWFFITHTDDRLDIANVGELTRVTQAIQDAIRSTGAAGDAPVDHIELSARRRGRTPTRGTSCSARAASTIGRRAGRGRRRRWRRCMRADSWRSVIHGDRRASRGVGSSDG